MFKHIFLLLAYSNQYPNSFTHCIWLLVSLLFLWQSPPYLHYPQIHILFIFLFVIYFEEKPGHFSSRTSHSLDLGRSLNFWWHRYYRNPGQFYSFIIHILFTELLFSSALEKPLWVIDRLHYTYKLSLSKDFRSLVLHLQT